MDDCFIIMPISTPRAIADKYGDPAHFSHVLDVLFRPAVIQAGLRPIPPSAEGADLIHAEIIKHLEQDALVLCDMTTVNPNVFFELGIRTAVNKPIVLVKDSDTTSVPFDTSIINHYTYDGSLPAWDLKNEIDGLSAHIKRSYTGSGGTNRLWHYFGLHSQARFEPGESPTESKLDLLSMEMAALKRSILDLRVAGESTKSLLRKRRRSGPSRRARCPACNGRKWVNIMGHPTGCAACSGSGYL